MTSAQFYQKLNEVGKRMVWRFYEGGALRGKFRHSKKHRYFCPITAVQYVESGCKVFIKDVDVDNAVEALSLNLRFAYSVVCASDNHGSQKVRRRLLKTVGVK